VVSPGEMVRPRARRPARASDMNCVKPLSGRTVGVESYYGRHLELANTARIVIAYIAVNDCTSKHLALGSPKYILSQLGRPKA